MKIDWQICAVKKKHNVVVKLLLSQTDVNLNLEDDQGSTALHYASTMQKLSGCYLPTLRSAQRMRKTMMEKLKL